MGESVENIMQIFNKHQYSNDIEKILVLTKQILENLYELHLFTEELYINKKISKETKDNIDIFINNILTTIENIDTDKLSENINTQISIEHSIKFNNIIKNLLTLKSNYINFITISEKIDKLFITELINSLDINFNNMIGGMANKSNTIIDKIKNFFNMILSYFYSSEKDKNIKKEKKSIILLEPISTGPVLRAEQKGQTLNINGMIIDSDDYPVFSLMKKIFGKKINIDIQYNKAMHEYKFFKGIIDEFILYLKFNTSRNKKYENIIFTKLHKSIIVSLYDYLTIYKQTILTQLNINNEPCSKEIALNYLKYLVQASGAVSALTIKIITCLISNLSALIATVGTNPGAFINLGVCLSHGLILYTLLVRLIKKNYIEQEIKILSSHTVITDQKVQIYLMTYIKEKTNVINSIIDQSKFARLKEKARELDSLIKELQLKLLDDFFNYYILDNNVIKIKPISNDKIVGITLEDYKLDIPIHILKDLFNILNNFKNDKRLIKQDYFDKIDIWNNPNILQSYYNTFTNDEEIIKQNELLLIAWRYIKHRQIKQQDGGTVENQFGGLFGRKPKPVLESVSLAKYFTDLLNKSYTPLDSSKLVDLEIYFLLLKNPCILNDIINKSSEFVSNDTFCSYVVLTGIEIPDKTDKETMDHISKSSNNKIEHIEPDKPIQYDQNNVSHILFILSCVRHFDNYKIILEEFIIYLKTIKEKEELINNDKIIDNTDKLLYMIYYLFTHIDNIKKIPELLGIKLSMLLDNQIYFESQIEKVKAEFPTEKENIISKCKIRSENEPKSLFSRFFGKKQKGGTRKLSKKTFIECKRSMKQTFNTYNHNRFIHLKRDFETLDLLSLDNSKCSNYVINKLESE
jgi:hypothetical protein